MFYKLLLLENKKLKSICLMNWWSKRPSFQPTSFFIHCDFFQNRGSTYEWYPKLLSFMRENQFKITIWNKTMNNGEPTLLVHCLYYMLTLNHKRTTSSLAPPLFYVAEKFGGRDKVEFYKVDRHFWHVY